MIVVKLGGSLYGTAELRLWLHALADYSSITPIIIVPGGGPFADQVRAAQQHHLFDDATAHQMALAAMKQFGLMLSGLEPHCRPFTLYKPIKPFSVWLPDDTLLTEAELSQSWDLTSDSLALWLASTLKAQQLYLVKHVAVNTASIQQLTDNNVIDRSFATLFAQYAIPTQIIHYQSHADFPFITTNQTTDTSLYLS